MIKLSGQEANTVLGQVDTVLGDAKYITIGLYELSYISPAVGTYTMDVELAHRGAAVLAALV